MGGCAVFHFHSRTVFFIAPLYLFSVNFALFAFRTLLFVIIKMGVSHRLEGWWPDGPKVRAEQIKA